MDKYRLHPVHNNMISFAGDFISEDFTAAINYRLMGIFTKNKTVIMEAFRDNGGRVL